MSEAPQQPPGPPQGQPLPTGAPPPPLPQPVLQYHQPLARPAAFTSAAFFRFTGAFAVAYIVVMTVSSKARPGQVLILATMSAALSGGVFALSCLVRRAVSRRGWGREQSGVVTMAAGAACAAAPTFIYVALVGRTETFPWVVIGWLACCVTASFIAYPAVVED